jgi:putative ABC transport system ATP-binding protein
MADVIILGKGPAGISAALYTARAGIKTTVIGRDGGSLEKAGMIENYYGFDKPISAKDLIRSGIKQAKRFGVLLIEDEVVGLGFDGKFNVLLKTGELNANSVILATGSSRKSPSISGLNEFEGKGISYCSTCDGFFYNNLKVGVLGFRDYAIHEAVELTTYTKDITIFTNGKELELINIDKYYNPGTVNEMCLFNHFNLTIRDGEFVSVVGSNGSGKTSMLNIICGSIPVDQGSIIINQEDITNMPEYKRQRRIGRVYQNPAMGTCPNMTILENMSLADNKGKSFNLLAGTDKKRIDYYRENLSTLNLGLEDKLDIPVGSLSGGQRQAMALLMAAMTPIEFLILDEHTAALDPKTAELIMELTDRIVKEKKLTTIMVTHNLRYAVEYGDRLLMMHQGEVIIDKAGTEKTLIKIDDILDKFNKISIECGN